MRSTSIRACPRETNDSNAQNESNEMSTQTLFNLNLSLFDKIISDDQLRDVFKEVKRNKGSPGVDGVTIDSFEMRLDEELGKLQQAVRGWTYEPLPVRRVEIPKPDGGVRILGVPSVRDRVLQASIRRALEPILDPTFSDHSYGFRPGRNQRQAVEAAQAIVKSGKEFVVDIDLSKFFDRIHHDRLIYRLGLYIEDKRILRLVGMTLRSGAMTNGVIIDTTEGATQGSPLSPLLSNLVLDELDKELEKRGLEFCRFADDCNIFVRTQHAAERVMGTVTKYIESKLKLVVNREKSKAAKSSAVKFLGMTIIAGAIAISAISMSRAMAKAKELTPRGTNITTASSVQKINSWYVGWSNYYKMTEYPSQLKTIEAHIRRRLRSRIVDQQKSRRNLFKLLMKHGVSRRHAAKTVFSNNRRWALSHKPAVEKAFPNAWFTKTLGLKVVSDKKLSHWRPVKEWIKLT